MKYTLALLLGVALSIHVREDAQNDANGAGPAGGEEPKVDLDEICALDQHVTFNEDGHTIDMDAIKAGAAAAGVDQAHVDSIDEAYVMEWYHWC